MVLAFKKALKTKGGNLGVFNEKQLRINGFWGFLGVFGGK